VDPVWEPANSLKRGLTLPAYLPQLNHNSVMRDPDPEVQQIGKQTGKRELANFLMSLQRP
jgi:hypothetical protein